MSEVGGAFSDLVEQAEVSEETVEEYLAGELQTEVDVTDLDPSWGEGEVFVGFELPEMTETVESCLGSLGPDATVDGSVTIKVGDAR